MPAAFSRFTPYLFLTLSQLMVAFNVVGSKAVSSHISLLLAVFIRFVCHLAL